MSPCAPARLSASSDRAADETSAAASRSAWRDAHRVPAGLAATTAPRRRWMSSTSTGTSISM
eukprot:1506224-Heterocapsa_arctica.AAC.1